MSEGDAEIDAETDKGSDAETEPTGPGLEKTAEVRESQLASVLESLIFVADKPVSDRQLAKAAGAKLPDVRAALDELKAHYDTRGIQLSEVSGGFQFRSALQNAPFVREFVARKPVRLTRAQVETLSIVAYRQPVTRPEIDEIRGVDSGAALKILAERGLLKILGRKEEVGRPLLYGTTPAFLEFFGLAGLGELPTLKEFTELSDESRGIFERRMGEPLDLAGAAREAAAAEEKAAAELLDDEPDEPSDTDDEPAEEDVSGGSRGESLDDASDAADDDESDESDDDESDDDAPDEADEESDDDTLDESDDDEDEPDDDESDDDEDEPDDDESDDDDDDDWDDEEELE